jgi:hypothetical protein
MIQIPLQNIANQSLSIQLDQNQIDLNFHATQDNPDGTSGVTGVDIIINNVVIVSGMRAVFGTPLIPYAYLEDGNFAFFTQNDEYPDWRQFGITQFLVYASQSELDAIYANAQ